MNDELKTVLSFQFSEFEISNLKFEIRDSGSFIILQRRAARAAPGLSSDAIEAGNAAQDFEPRVPASNFTPGGAD
jgi:hypothetical protein